MVLLFLVIIGVAIFCFFQGYYVSGIICLFGFSEKTGFIALVITSIMLFYNSHWAVGVVPLLLVGINLIFRDKNNDIMQE
jgi:hypothetical protein